MDEVLSEHVTTDGNETAELVIATPRKRKPKTETVAADPVVGFDVAPSGSTDPEQGGDSMAPATTLETASTQPPLVAEAGTVAEPGTEAKGKKKARYQGTRRGGMEGRLLAKRQRAQDGVLRETWEAEIMSPAMPVTLTLGSHEAQDAHKRLYIATAKMIWQVHVFDRLLVPGKAIAEVEAAILDNMYERRNRLTAARDRFETFVEKHQLERAVYPRCVTVTEHVVTKGAKAFLEILRAYDSFLLVQRTVLFHDYNTSSLGTFDPRKEVFGAHDMVQGMLAGLYARIKRQPSETPAIPAPANTGEAGFLGVPTEEPQQSEAQQP
jgi:hypothetical protein